MKWRLSMTRRTASSTSARIVSYWARRSSSGTLVVVVVFVDIGVSLVSVRGGGSRVHPALVLEQLFDRNGAHGLRGLAHDDRARRHVARDRRARRHEAVLADRDAGQRDAAGADAAALLHRDTLEVLEALLRAADEVVVRRHDAGRDEHAILERRIGGDVALALELAVAADRAEVLDG